MSKKINKVQCEILAKRMRENPKMAKGIVRRNRDLVRRFWKLLSAELNRAGPPEKNESEWKKAWFDQRRYERQKAPNNASIKKSVELLQSNERLQEVLAVEEYPSDQQSSTVMDCHSNSSSQSFSEEINDADYLTQTNKNADSTKVLLKRLHLSVEQLCKQKQMELDETKRHNIQMEMLEQERNEINSRLLQLKEEKLKLLRQATT